MSDSSPPKSLLLSDDLWPKLPELIRNYPEKTRASTRELAYSLYDRFTRSDDADGLTRLRFALETREDLSALYRQFDARL